MSAGGGGSEASARPDGVLSSHVSQAEGPLAGKRRRALVPAAGGGGLTKDDGGMLQTQEPEITVV